MKRIWQITFLLIAVLVIGIAYFSSQSDQELVSQPKHGGFDVAFRQEIAASLQDIPEMSESDVDSILQHAMQSERAILFLDVDWSATAKYLLPRYVEYTLRYHDENATDPILFHYVNLTGLKGHSSQIKKKIPGLETIQRQRGTAVFHGNGEVVWLKNGRAVDIKPLMNLSSPEEFVNFTKQILPGNG